jgi:hypothetical protein
MNGHVACRPAGRPQWVVCNADGRLRSTNHRRQLAWPGPLGNAFRVGLSSHRIGVEVAKQRSTFGKLERQRAQQATAKAKHERRTARSAEGPEPPPAPTDPAEEAAILEKFAKLQAAFDDGQINLEDFEVRRNELRDRLQT